MGAAVRSIIIPLLLAAIGLALAVPVSSYMEQVRPGLPDGYDDSDLQIRGAQFKGFALGMEGLIADWYWMRSLQYIGNKIERSKTEDINIDDLRDLDPRLLYPLLENATELDPHFIAPYSYGALVLPAIDPEKAITIAHKGITNNPTEWRLYQYLGYIYWRLGRYDEAAAAYDRGSLVPGAAPFMKLMAAAMQTKGGDRATARQVFRQMLMDQTDPQVKITAERRLAEIESLDERDAIDTVLDERRRRAGSCAADLREVIPDLARMTLPEGNQFQLDMSGRLVDPTGAPYRLDIVTCKVKLDNERTGLPTR